MPTSRNFLWSKKALRLFWSEFFDTFQILACIWSIIPICSPLNSSSVAFLYKILSPKECVKFVISRIPMGSLLKIIKIKAAEETSSTALKLKNRPTKQSIKMLSTANRWDFYIIKLCMMPHRYSKHKAVPIVKITSITNSIIVDQVKTVNWVRLF